VALQSISCAIAGRVMRRIGERDESVMNAASIVGRPLAGQPRARVFGLGVCLSLCCWLLFAEQGSAFAQELTPRAYWPAPRGTKLLIAGYSYSWGDVVTDPSLPVVGVDSQINSGVVAYQQTVNLAGRTANVQVQLPYVDGETEGVIAGQPRNRSVSGVGDLMATVSVNLMGAPSMSLAEFQEFRRNPSPILAASLNVVAPTGEYESDKLINIGTNRWAAKLKVAYLQPLKGRLVLEMGAGVWFFEDNDDFLGGTREQEPLAALELNLVKRFRPGFWGSIDANYYFGGRTIVNGEQRADFQRNSRLGVSVAYPFKQRNAVKVSLSTGVLAEAGGDYNTLSLSYIYLLD